MKMEQIQNDLSLKRKIFILMKDIVKFLIVETNPIRKVTLLKTYIERNEQIFCFKNTNVISLINSILIWKIFLALRYLIFSLVKTSVEFKLLWFDVITLFTALKNINAFERITLLTIAQTEVTTKSIDENNFQHFTNYRHCEI